MIKRIVAWDLGATKCTAGIVELDDTTTELSCKKNFTVQLANTNSLQDLIGQLELGLNFSMQAADAICIAAAGHYDGQALLHENAYPYVMDFANIAQAQKWRAFDVIHDYAPIVCATFTSYMQEKNIKRLNNCPMNLHGRRVALGIGTGLGLKDGVLFPNGDFWLGKNEIGHIGVTTPPIAHDSHLKRHQEFLSFLQQKLNLQENQPITFEKVLSGQGIVRLYQFFYPTERSLTPEEVGIQMQENKIDEMLDAFAWYIGLFVGTVQLIFMPEGGVWITGGVSIRHSSIFDRKDFLEGIHASPAYLAQRQEYPLGVLRNHEHALMGCGYYASRRLIHNSHGS